MQGFLHRIGFSLRLFLRQSLRLFFAAVFVLAMVTCPQAAQAAEPDYLTITNTGGTTVTVYFAKQGGNYTTNNVNIAYSINGGEWSEETTYGTAANNQLSFSLPGGQNVRFRGYNLNGNAWQFGKGTSIYFYLRLPNTTTYTVSGDIMSLVAYKDGTLHTDEYPLGNYCFTQLFKNCTTIRDASALSLPATMLGKYCYSSLFTGCSALRSVPTLPATEMADYCYNSMFSNCTSLTATPELPSTELAPYCYYLMFNGCTSLKSVPDLPATTLQEGCYGYMFQNCSALVTAQDTLPGTNMPKFCYQYMFAGCTALTTAPEIMTEADAAPGQGACDNMFAGCTALVKAPSHLFAGKLGYNMTYSHMFYNCPNLTEGPDIHASTITASNPLQYMYHSSGNLRKIRVYFKAWGSLSFCSYWTYGVAGKGAFYCPPELPRTYNGTKTTPSYIPDNWTVFSYNLTYIPVEGEWPTGGTAPQQYTWQTDTNYVQGWMRELDAARASYWHDAACTQPFAEEEIIAFLATQQETSSDITKNIYVKLGEVEKLKITFLDHDNKELAVVEVAKGTVPAYPNTDPAPYSVGDKIYYFSGWTPAIVAATEDATYKAVYTDSPRYEFVSYKLEDEDKNEFECTPAAKPVVLTNDATSVTSDGAVLNGLVSSDGGLTVTERGFCWGTASDDLANCSTAGSGTGAFTYTLSGLTASTTYYFQAYAANGSGTARGEVKSFTTEAPAATTGSNCNHDWVQLWAGGPKWATVNLGASSETDAGNYYMYAGTTANPASCSWSNCPYKGSNQNSSPYTKYGVAADGNIILQQGDDAAAQAWGCGWRMPTRDEMLDLLSKCTVTYNQSKRGYTFTSKENTSLSIFMPTAGYKNGSSVFNVGKYARYLTATSIASPSTKDRDCYILYWYTNSSYGEDHKPEANTQSVRYWGMSVRAVCD